MNATTGLGLDRVLLCLIRYSAAGDQGEGDVLVKTGSHFCSTPFSRGKLTLLLHVTTDLSDEDDAFGCVVLKEKLDEVEGGGTWVWVTSDSDTDGLSQADCGGLCDGLVRKCSGSRDDSCGARSNNGRIELG